MVVTCKSVVYITLEYCEADLFSGNGVCARSQVRHMAASSMRVHVICGRPKEAVGDDASIANVSVSTVPLDAWFSTERACAHEQFAKGAAKILDGLKWHDYDACLGVDWTGMDALRAAPETLMKCMAEACVPIIYINLRSYMSMTNISEEDRAFYKESETAAVRFALKSGGGVVSLCNADDETLRALAPSGEAFGSMFRVLLPMLRAEFATIAREDRGAILDDQRKRMYLTSLVRLSEDKGAHRFVSMLHRIQNNDPDFWTRTGVVPLVLGAHTQPEYSKRIHEDLTSAVPQAIIIDEFLPPARLADVLQQSILNVHPALYEAYGLTIVEAAAMGCPSIINKEGIGAAQLLNPADGATIAVDIADEEALSKVVCDVITNDEWRGHIAHQAYLRATSWTEAEYVRELLSFVGERVEATKNAQSN